MPIGVIAYQAAVVEPHYAFGSQIVFQSRLNFSQGKRLIAVRSHQTAAGCEDGALAIAFNGAAFKHEVQMRLIDALHHTGIIELAVDGVVLFCGELIAPAVELEVEQQPQPDDYVVATSEYPTVREFATLAFHEVGIELEWRGEGINEKGYDKATGRSLVEVDPKYFRPAEVEQLLGNPAKAKAQLGWNPQKTSFPELVKIMVEHDMKFVKKLFLKAQLDKE